MLNGGSMIWEFCVYFVYMIPLETDVLRKHRFQKPPSDKINDFPTWDPNTSLSFLTSIVRVSTQMKMKEAMYSMNKTY